MSTTTVNKIPALVMVASLLLWGCGSDDPAPTEPEDEGTAGNVAPGKARVTIGSTTWTATAVAGGCVNFGGDALGFVGTADDDSSITITLDAVPVDPSSNSARVDVNDSVSWRAGEAVLGDGGTIPVVTAQNGYGTGSATFVNTYDPDGFSTGTYETASGDYEFNCS